MKSIKMLFIISVLITASLFLSACFARETAALGAGDKAPDFTLELLSGGKTALSDMLKDKKAVLVFWATWCPACREEIPHVEKFYNDNKDTVAVLGIDLQESKEKVSSFVKKTNMSYPVALDIQGSVANTYGIVGIPTVVAIDKDGKIIYYGYSLQEMEERLR